MKLYETYCPRAAELCISTVLCFHLMAHHWRLIWQGWVPLGKQALVELRRGFWSPSVTSEGGHIYASGVVRMTLDQKDGIEIEVERSCNTLRDADMIKKVVVYNSTS